MSAPRILIEVRGGIVQDVTTDSKEALVFLVDRDDGCITDDRIRESAFSSTVVSVRKFDNLLDDIDKEIEADKRRMEEDERKRREQAWQSDSIQFTRLLAELKAAGLTANQLHDLRVSMGLSNDQICELLDRAEEKFEKLKEQHAPRGTQ